MPSVIMPSVNMPSAIMPSVNVQCVNMPSVNMPSAIMLSVVVPWASLFWQSPPSCFNQVSVNRKIGAIKAGKSSGTLASASSRG
jgi:hypothetical protein